MKNNGYSLVELLITISIAAVLTTFGFSAYRHAQDRQLTRATGEILEKALQKAQKDATSGNKDCDGTLQGIEVLIPAGGNTVTLTAKCRSGDGTPTIYTLNNTTFAATTNIMFRPLNSGLVFVPPTTDDPSHNIDFTVATSGLTHRIFVGKPGSIIYEGEVAP